MGCPAGAGDHHLETSSAGGVGIAVETLGRAMRRDDADLMGNAEPRQGFRRMAHGFPVRLAAHHDADGRCAAVHAASNPLPERAGIIGGGSARASGARERRKAVRRAGSLPGQYPTECDGNATFPLVLYLPQAWAARSEEHTSELQSLMRISYAVFCL